MKFKVMKEPNSVGKGVYVPIQLICVTVCPFTLSHQFPMRIPMRGHVTCSFECHDSTRFKTRVFCDD